MQNPNNNAAQYTGAPPPLPPQLSQPPYNPTQQQQPAYANTAPIAGLQPASAQQPSTVAVTTPQVGAQVAQQPQQFGQVPGAAGAGGAVGQAPVDPQTQALLTQQYYQYYQQYYQYYQQQNQQTAATAAAAAAAAALATPGYGGLQQHEQAWGVPQPNQHGLYSLFVYHLPRSMTEKALTDLFSQYGSVVEAVVMRENNSDPSSPSKGYGFVNYRQYHEAQAAIDGLNGYHIENKRLQVSFKSDKKGVAKK